MKIFAIIVTYNPKKWIEKCFESLINSSVNLDIIVVDNGSIDGSQEIIKQKFPRIIFIQNEKNLGFGKANNIGIEIAYKNNADYFFLVNQDAWLEKNTIEKLLKNSQANPNYGILSPLHFNGLGKNLDLGFKNGTKIDTTLINKNLLLEVPFINAAIWLITRNCIEKVGGFSPVFFHYSEDNNYVSRVNFHHLKVGVVCNAVGYHDREFRAENKFYADNYKVLERDLIMTLSDPNLNSNIAKIFVATFFNFLKSFFFDKDNFQKNKLYLKAIFNVNYKNCIRFREISKTQRLAFLDL